MRNNTRENVGDNIRALIGAEVMLPSQWEARRARKMAGEERLAWAVLEQVVETLQSGVVESKIAKDLEWVNSDTETEPYSFVNLCGYLRLDVSAVRSRLQNLERNNTRRATKDLRFRSDYCTVAAQVVPGHRRGMCRGCRTQQDIARRSRYRAVAAVA